MARYSVVAPNLTIESTQLTFWDLNETNQLVRRKFGPVQESLARESSRSVLDRKAFSSYHFAEVMRLSKAFERKHLADAKTILEIHALGSEKKDRAFQIYMVKAGAHSVAAVQSLHAIPDIFAHAVYFASAQNLQPHALVDSDISLPRVANCLNQDKSFAVLVDKLRAIQAGPGWRHITAVSNMSKHRSVVRAAYNEDWTGERVNPRELHVSAFVWHGRPYPSVSLHELLEPEYKRLMTSVIGLAHELNMCLRAAP
jgi:hypothetical protein